MSTLNVVRYSALVGGIAYGILHRRTLQKEADTHAVEQQAKQRESWIEQAKQEYAKKNQGSKKGGLAGLLSGAADKVEQVTGSSSVISDPEDPKFDLEKLVAHWEKQASA